MHNRNRAVGTRTILEQAHAYLWWGWPGPVSAGGERLLVLGELHAASAPREQTPQSRAQRTRGRGRGNGGGGKEGRRKKLVTETQRRNTYEVGVSVLNINPLTLIYPQTVQLFPLPPDRLPRPPQTDHLILFTSTSSTPQTTHPPPLISITRPFR